MAKIVLPVGAETVELDTDNAAASQAAYVAAYERQVQARILAANPQPAAPETEETDEPEPGAVYLAARIIAAYKASSNPMFSGQVDTEEKVAALQAELQNLPISFLTKQHDAAVTLSVKKAQTSSEAPDDPTETEEQDVKKTDLTGEEDRATLAARYAPKSVEKYATA